MGEHLRILMGFLVRKCDILAFLPFMFIWHMRKSKIIHYWDDNEKYWEHECLLKFIRMWLNLILGTFEDGCEAFFLMRTQKMSLLTSMGYISIHSRLAILISMILMALKIIILDNSGHRAQFDILGPTHKDVVPRKSPTLIYVFLHNGLTVWPTNLIQWCPDSYESHGNTHISPTAQLHIVTKISAIRRTYVRLHFTIYPAIIKNCNSEHVLFYFKKLEILVGNLCNHYCNHV